jgi:hypothetical protein
MRPFNAEASLPYPKQKKQVYDSHNTMFHLLLESTLSKFEQYLLTEAPTFQQQSQSQRHCVQVTVALLYFSLPTIINPTYIQ